MSSLRPLLRTALGFVASAWLLLAAGPSSAQEFTLPDARMALASPLDVPTDWAVARGTWVEVHGERYDEPLLRSLAEHTDTRLKELAATLRVPIGGTVHIYVAPSKRAFDALQGDAVPEYADGTAWPVQGRIFLHRPADRAGATRPIEQVLDHELVHVLLGRAFAPGHTPRWLQEGVAQVVANESDADETRRMVSQAWLRGPFRLAELDAGFPADAASARLAYAQSADLIRFLQVRHGTEVLPRMVRELARDGRIAVALPRATGESLPDLERAWLASLDTGVPRWLLAAGDPDVWWFSLGLIATGSLIVGRRRARKRLRDYAEEEARQDALIASLLGGLHADRRTPRAG